VGKNAFLRNFYLDAKAMLLYNVNRLDRKGDLI